MLPPGLDTELALVDTILLRIVATRASAGQDLASLVGSLAASHRPGELRTVGDGELPRADLDLPPATSPIVRCMLRAWGLADIDRLLVALALAPELDPHYSVVFAALAGSDERGRPTLGFAHELVNAATGDVTPLVERFAREQPLGQLPIVELVGEGPAPQRALALADDVLALLLGSPLADPHWALEPADDSGDHDEGAAWARARATWLVAIRGARGSGCYDRARTLAAALGKPTLALDASSLVATVTARLARDAQWHDAVIVIRDVTSEHRATLRALAELTPAPIIVTGDAALSAALDVMRPVLDVAQVTPDVATRMRTWSRELDRQGVVGIDADGLAERFALTREPITAAIRVARERAAATGGVPDTGSVVAAVRTITRSRLGEIAALLAPAEPDRLIVPREVRRELELAATWMQRGAAASAAFDLPERHLTCLFHGAPGTGKTLAARVLAHRIGVDAFRIDLSQIVSKYIGETEKNLARIFDESEAAHALLFFDEADALFAKRTEVHSSNDRFANIESGYLLQRLENHRGPVILATNLARNIEPAMMRRLQIVIEFPLPGTGERLAIWERYLIGHRADFDLPWLAEKFALSGAAIRDAAVAATVLAMRRGDQLAMRDLVVAVWREMRRSGRMIEPRELGPWLDRVREYIEADH